MNRLRARLSAVRSSYWFVPSLMALSGILLGGIMIWVDASLGASWIEGLGWYQQVRTDGAREVLSTIAGSMVTVAGVVFSITIVALSYASSQYGPRVLTNFMDDRGNTVTLGTFIATFLYSLMVLRTIRGGEEDFVPQYSVIVGMLLAVCSIGVLIYFIHHVLQSIHINHVVEKIGRQLVEDARIRFPRLIGKTAPKDRSPSAELKGEVAVTISNVTGYIQALDGDRLLDIARKADVLVRLRYRPGDFVMEGRGLADIAPCGNWSDERGDELRACFTVGAKRTPEHDLMFLVSELVEIAARALSPGVNDPMTAVTCLDWLGAGGTEFATRELPEPVRVDKEGASRLITSPDDFRYFVDQSFGRLRQYAAGDTIAALHLLRVVGEVAAACRRPDQIDVLRAETSRFAELAMEQLDGPNGRAVQERATALQSLLSNGVGQIDARQADWLGGSA
ncbi:DUF2254 domain-containing protein [Sphingomonas glaciei]|uniref:DUF2254 domain-containing protein n=1 Tax=Sphingomonas glaciei TaxID=2938948 RepID=A0ABY5MVX2_9SPHN|nr:DUF2254 domain-containing protein [Sphingomonas glaciei]UUR08129.1 DUF2254 domain-containing protein [Sphingomonas glaciei]